MAYFVRALVVALFLYPITASAQNKGPPSLEYWWNGTTWLPSGSVNPLPVSATVTATATTTATAAATPPTVSAGPNNPLIIDLHSSLFVQPTFAGTPVDGTHGLPVNCIVGCAGGSLSNAGSGVATTSTNLGTIGYGYGFNGTTWDQLQVTAAKELKTSVTSGQINLALVNTAPATQNVTAQDTATTSTTVANGQVFLTGTPTTNSAAIFTLTNGQGTMRVQVTGTWTGTLNTEVSMDGGTTYVTKAVHQIGTAYTLGAYTANFIGEGTIEGVTNIRVRATGSWTGTATIKVVQSVMPEQFYIGNPMKMQDTTNQSITDTIKAASTAAVATDPALVVAISPNNQVATAPGTRTIVTLDVKTVTTGGTAVTAISAGHRTAGGFIQNPTGATANLGINEIGTASGTTSAGDTTFIVPGQTYTVAPAAGAVSVISSDSSHPFSGYGLE